MEELVSVDEARSGSLEVVVLFKPCAGAFKPCAGALNRVLVL
jgi:hypothetical protein